MRKITFIKPLMVLISCFGFTSWGQTAVFSENMGTVTGTCGIPINPFQNSELVFSGTAQVRSTPQSSDYTGASGGRNVYLTNSTNQYFAISGIDTSQYESLGSLSFALHKNNSNKVSISSTQFVVEVATDYDPINNVGTFTALSYPTFSLKGWNLIVIDGSVIPFAPNLTIRFRQNQTTSIIRIDDVVLTGVPKDVIYENGVWTGTPNITKDVIIRDFLTVDGVNQGNFSAKTITLEEEGGVDIMENYSVTVEGAIVSNGNFTVRNGANLVQTDDVVNIGEVTVLVNSNSMRRLDWTLWSSPVAGQNLYDFSPQTVTSRIYNYNPATDEYHNAGITSSSEFEEGVAFLFRAPNNYSPTVPTVFEGEFTGVPYNGTVEVDVVASAYNGLGNPYPSAINTEAFFDANPGVHSIYFWQNVPLNEDETGYDGPIYVVNTAAGSTIPSGLERIAVGQGFIAWIESGINEVVFDNSMRRTQSGVFYKTKENEKNRLWLNLSQAEGNSINNILIAYMVGATNGFDDQIDGEFLGYYGTALYNIVEDSEAIYAVQGRSLPFTDSDTVALGFRALEAGSYTISLANFDGLFLDGQDVFIKDNLTKTEQNLKDGDYTFVSDKGVFEDRFEVVYKPMGDLSVNNPQYDNKWVVYKQGNGFRIETQGFEMKEVMVYDMLGRTVYNSSAEGASHTISNIANGVLIVKVITTDNQTLIRKTAK